MRGGGAGCAAVPRAPRAGGGGLLQRRARHPVTRRPPPPPPLQCKKEGKGLELISISEYDVCKYKMVLGLPQWCTIDPSTIGTPSIK